MTRAELKAWRERDARFDSLFDLIVAHQLDERSTREAIASDSAFQALSVADLCELRFRLGEVVIDIETALQKLGRLPQDTREDVLRTVAGTLDIETIKSQRTIARLILVATRTHAMLDFTNRR